ncbi:MAG: NAD(P)/FAD-dependent oxidoreductase [Geminicoccaceae bacterium]
MTGSASGPADRYDVVVIGGGFTGSASALLLKRFVPEARILILERRTAFDHKVGEATVEVSSYFLHHVLGLYDHLSRDHLPKHGLRYWFTDGPSRRLSEMSEVGSWELPRLPAFQLNRQVLDEHLLEQASSKGASVRRGVRINSIDQGWPESRINLTLDGKEKQIRTRWIIDASGRDGVLATKNGLRQYFDNMTTSALWARFRNVADMDASESNLFDDRVPAITASRRLATNHFCGYGWWCWVIPLGDRQTSIGLVYDHRLFDPGLSEGGPRKAFWRFLSSQPGLRELIVDADMVEDDFHLRHRLAYTTKAYAGKGWAMVGDAASFLDPFYSPGLDHASFSVFASSKIIAADLVDRADAMLDQAATGDGALEEALSIHNAKFARSIRHWLNGLYVDKYEIMGDAELMRCSFLVDTALYYLGVVGPVLRNLDELRTPVFGLALPQTRYSAKFMRFFKGRLVKLARFRLQTARYGHRNIGWHIYGRAFDLNWPSVKILFKGLRAWAGLELEYLRHRLSGRQIDVSKPASSQSIPITVRSTPGKAATG